MLAKDDQATVAVFAGSGALPLIVVRGIAAGDRSPIVFGINGEADLDQFNSFIRYDVRWGQIGRITSLIEQHCCTQAVLVGKVVQRPDYLNLVPDMGAIRLLPRILKMMRGGDNSVLSEAAGVFAEHGVDLVSPLDVAPDLAMPAGLQSTLQPKQVDMADAAKAMEAAKAIGQLDIGQAAVAVGGRVVAVEGAEGTDGLLARIRQMREQALIPGSGGVLAKCMKPNQDPRLDVPAIGPDTAARAKEASLSGVIAEAGRTLLIGRDDTLAAFEARNLFLMGIVSTEINAGLPVQ